MTATALTNEGWDFSSDTLHTALAAFLSHIEFEDEDSEEAVGVGRTLEVLHPSDPSSMRPDYMTCPIKDGSLTITVTRRFIQETQRYRGDFVTGLKTFVRSTISVITSSGSYAATLNASRIGPDSVFGLDPGLVSAQGGICLDATEIVDADWLKRNPAMAAAFEVFGSRFDVRMPMHHMPTLPDSGDILLDCFHKLYEGSKEARKAEASLAAKDRDTRAVRAQLVHAQRRCEALEARGVLLEARAKEAKSQKSLANPAQSDSSATSDSDEAVRVLQSQLSHYQALANDRQLQNDAMRREIYELQQLLDARRTSTPLTDTAVALETPSDFDALPQWAEAALAGRVLLHPKAIAAALESNYQNPAKVYACLQALADLYWPMLYDTDNRDPKAWDARCAELGVECSKVGAAATDTKTADYYTVTHEGRRLVADMHLRGNSSFDPRFGLRIYWARDDEHRTLVVTSLPSHLPNRVS